MSSLGIPYIIFRNTDNDEAVDIDATRTVVSIKRQGSFVRSGPEFADEVNSLTVTQCHTYLHSIKDRDIQGR